LIPPGWSCPRRIGFLFPHPCERTSPIGCPDCENGQIADPYRDRTDRGGYIDYDEYDEDLGTAAPLMEFTEADGEHLVESGEVFEDDLTES
jgi:hypothetical protein